MDEKSIERRLREKIKDELGGVAYKFTSPQRRSVPDRLCCLPSGVVFFVECKSPGKKLTKLQKREKDNLEALGFAVYVADNYSAVDTIVECYKTS